MSPNGAPACVADGYTLAWNASLRDRNTFRLDAHAHCLATVRGDEALHSLLERPDVRGLPVLVLGEGSNVLFATARYEGLVVHLAGDRAVVVEQDTDRATVHVEAAFPWDALVDWTIERGLRGLENLALIPGQSGAAPIQNIGAYGAEVGEFVLAVHAYDRGLRQAVTLSREACEFGYRDSVFKREPDRRIVTALELQLPRTGPGNVAYAGLREELESMGGLEATPRNVAAAVRRIRRRRLPDPAVVGNAGSFFKNPIVPRATAGELRSRHEGLPVFPCASDEERKLSAAWLIERAGWRGFREGDAGISAQHALVLVNHGSATGSQLLGVARRVRDSVAQQFGVSLEPEPRIIGAEF